MIEPLSIGCHSYCAPFYGCRSPAKHGRAASPSASSTSGRPFQQLHRMLQEEAIDAALGFREITGGKPSEPIVNCGVFPSYAFVRKTILWPIENALLLRIFPPKSWYLPPFNLSDQHCSPTGTADGSPDPFGRPFLRIRGSCRCPGAGRIRSGHYSGLGEFLAFFRLHASLSKEWNHSPSASITKRLKRTLPCAALSA